MPFTLIEGTFHVVGYSPDGDTIRFRANDEANWKKLAGPPIKINARRHVSLRFEAIDALETHFQNRHQPLQLAEAAQQFLLDQAGIRNVQWDAAHATVTAADEATPGYILSREVEVNRRAVSFVFSGAPPQPDGSAVNVTGDWVRQSLNYQSMLQGLVYPTYYEGLFPDLRQVFTEASQEARENGRGIWPLDKTQVGVEVLSLQTVTDQAVILPKLFRRMVSYLEGGGSIHGFKQFLADNPDPLLILDTGHFTHLDTIVEENGDVIRMNQPPENLVFEPKVSS